MCIFCLYILCAIVVFMNNLCYFYTFVNSYVLIYLDRIIALQCSASFQMLC